MYRATLTRRVKASPWIVRSPSALLLAAVLATVVPAFLVRLLERVGGAADLDAPLLAAFFHAMSWLTRGVALGVLGLVMIACVVAAGSTLRSRPPRPHPLRAVAAQATAFAIGVGGVLYLA